MQTPQITPPAPPAPPSPVEQPIAVTVTPGGVTTIQTPVVAGQLPSASFLRARGAELSRQITSASSRREDAARDYRRASEASRPGIQQRIDVLDARIVDLEKAIAENGRMLALVGGTDGEATTLAQANGNPFGLHPGQITGLGIVFTIFVLFPIALSMARVFWKRGTRIGTAPITNPEADQRMLRLEQGVDAIAVEVERISEGQRFVTQLMTNNAQNAIGAGQPLGDALHAPLHDTVMAGMRRSEPIR